MGTDFRPVLSAAQAPTAEQRVALVAHLANLDRAMQPATMEEAATHFTALLVSFPAQQMGQEAAKAKAQAYFIALEGLPKWAISGACRKWLRGEVEDLKDVNLAFAPSPPQMRRLADTLVRDVAWHAVLIRRLLDAKVLPVRSEVECAAMAARLATILPLKTGVA